MTVQVPVFTSEVTTITADFANTVSQLVYGVFGAAGTAGGARQALGLGTLAVQNAQAVQIAGGSIDNTTIGYTTPANAKFTIAYILDAPVAPQHAVNKAYVDGLVESASGMIVSLEEQYVAKIGGAMTGPLLLSGDPVLDAAAATKHYVDQQITIRLASTLNTYQALRQYNGSASAIEITAAYISGLFILDTADDTTPDNNGTVIVDNRNRRWKREFTDAVAVEWFGGLGDGVNNDQPAFAAAAALQYPIAMRDGATYLFATTLTMQGGVFILRNRATIKLQAGVIVNTDSNAGHFTPLLRLQGMSFVDLGQTVFDHNAANQTYPATLSQFGRGTQPFLHNGTVEITPDAGGTVSSSNIHAENATFQGAYINDLVLWQAVNVWVDECVFSSPTINGISVCGGRSVRLFKNAGYKCGVSTVFPASRNYNARTLINIQEYPTGLTSISEGIPCINTGEFIAGGINKFIEVSENYGEQCSTNTLRIRATLGLTGGRNRSYNVGYKRPVAAPSRSAHFDLEYCDGSNTENVAFQDTVVSGDIQPDGMQAIAMSGTATAAFPLVGTYRLDVRGTRLHSAKGVTGNKLTGLLNYGLKASSNVVGRNMDIDGADSDGIWLSNLSTYESPQLAPHDSAFDGSVIVNVTGNPIQIQLTGTVTGSVVTNVSAENVTPDAGKEPIIYNANVNTVANPPVNVRFSTGTGDWHVTLENVQKAINDIFLRQATNSSNGTAAVTAFAAVGDSGQAMQAGVTSSGYTGTFGPALAAFLQSTAGATAGLMINTAAGPVVVRPGNNRSVTHFQNGNTRFGTATNDDGNLVQLGGTLGIAQYTTATLPATPNGSPLAFATDGCKLGEASGAGTGCLVYFSAGKWRNIYSDQPVNTHAGQPTFYVAGTWDASANHVNGDTNTSLATGGLQTVNVGTVAAPTYSSVSGNGAVYRVTVAGTTSIDGYAQWDVDDLVTCVSGKWVKLTVNFNNVVFNAGTF